MIVLICPWTKYLGGAAVCVSILIGTTAQEAQALWITTSQGDYNVGILYNQSDSDAEVLNILDEQAWWGDSVFAAEVTVQVGDSFVSITSYFKTVYVFWFGVCRDVAG